VALAETIAALGVPVQEVISYPLAIKTALPRVTPGGFSIDVEGPPGIYKLFRSEDLSTWSELETATNTFGAARFLDTTDSLPPQRFYRVARNQNP